jgi:hypothetical protein
MLACYKRTSNSAATVNSPSETAKLPEMEMPRSARDAVAIDGIIPSGRCPIPDTTQPLGVAAALSHQLKVKAAGMLACDRPARLAEREPREI